MFGLLTTFLAGPYGFMLKLGTILLILGTIWFAGVRFEHNRMLPKLEAAKSDAELWQKTAENRKSLIEAQNAAVEGLKVAHELRVSTLQKKLATAILEVKNFREAAERRADLLANMELPENECSAVFALIDQARK